MKQFLKGLAVYIVSGLGVGTICYQSSIREKNVWGIDKKECFTDAVMIGAIWIIALPLFLLFTLVSFVWMVFEKVCLDF